MKRQIYMAAFAGMLFLIAITFYFQIKTMPQGNPYQWHLLAVIVLVGVASYFLSRKMHKEAWFGKQH